MEREAIAKDTVRFWTGVPNAPKKINPDKPAMKIFLYFIQHLFNSFPENGKGTIAVTAGSIAAFGAALLTIGTVSRVLSTGIGALSGVSCAEGALEGVEVSRVAGAAVNGEFNGFEAGAVTRHDGCRRCGDDRRVVAERAASECAEHDGLFSVRRRNVEDSGKAAFVDCAEFVGGEPYASVAVAAIHAVAWTLAQIRRRA